ncbi:Na(+)-translocating NADH-quinone reductase subunit A [Salicola sp. Rm-C-2C1-2]|uniref:Na(+)-translocating NADH-quinone reductase subunit A n=1 Tax=Salicola sp. Rm-C-2C1-2 TaxID=3141321 RepID=UPI0032E3E3E3
MIKIKKGLDLPMTGAPEPTIDKGRAVRHVALTGFDYVGMKPTLKVREGERVKRGQPVFTDKKNEGVVYTAPAGGTVREINRGERRVFQSLVIEVDENEEAETFSRYSATEIDGLARQDVVDYLVNAGMWPVLRTRPYSKVPAIDAPEPHSIFVSVMDTHPLAPDPQTIINQDPEAFENGLRVLARLTSGAVHLCGGPGARVPMPSGEQFQQHTFDGPHPAGNVGTHIHFIDPVGGDKVVWTVGYQNVIDLGRLFTTGMLPTEQIVAITGPCAAQPRLLRTRIGASLEELVEGELDQGDLDIRLVNGSVLGGRAARGPVNYLARNATQITALEEGYRRYFMGWLSPGPNRFSRLNIYLSKLMPGKRFSFTTTTNGSERAMVPIGAYEEIMPLDILPTQLLRSLIVQDTEQAQQLGALELDEDDLALCTFVCPGKYEYGPILRQNLTRIEIEG